MSLEKYGRYALIYFFPLMMIDYYLIMRGINYNTIILLPLIGLIGLCAVKIMLKPSRRTIENLFKAWIIYSIFSIVFYSINDTPISCYTETLRSALFPVCFAFLGFTYDDEKVNRNYMIACASCFLIGFYLYFTAPSYYSSFLISVREKTWYMQDTKYITDESIMEITRFCSFFGSSYAISFFSIPALTLSLDKITNRNNYNESKGLRYLYYIVAVSSFIAAILCQQRVSMACAILIMAYYVWVDTRKGNRTLILIVSALLAMTVFAVFALGMADRFNFIQEVLEVRFQELSFGQAYSERVSQNDSFDRMTAWSMITGLGLGSCGHAASAVGLKSINDGEFIKLFYEYGVLGFSIFALIIIKTLLRGCRYFKHLKAEVIIFLFYMVACTGSSALDMLLYSVFFWFTVGRIWNDNYLSSLINKQNTTC